MSASLYRQSLCGAYAKAISLLDELHLIFAFNLELFVYRPQSISLTHLLMD